MGRETPDETTPEVVDAQAIPPEQAEQFKPTASELVVTDMDDEQHVFVVLDRHDEEQIIEEFQRRALRVMLYDFTARGRRLIDLSYAGVLEAIRLMNNTGRCRIHIDPASLQVETVTEDAGSGPERFYIATVYAADAATGAGQFGTSLQPVMMRRRDGRTQWDPFARTKAINKAQRNALRTMIPTRMRELLIAQYKGDDVAVRAIQVGAQAGAKAELPPPLTDEKAERQKQQARELYRQVQELAPGGIAVGLPPALFHQYLTHAEHSHDRLDDFLGFLRQKLDDAGAEKPNGG